jgi:hypothetical protein
VGQWLGLAETRHTVFLLLLTVERISRE